MSIGEKIAAARKARGWSQEELGFKTDVSTQAVSKWENDLSVPDRKHLVRLADLLELSLDELLGDVPTPGWMLGSPYFNPEHTGIRRTRRSLLNTRKPSNCWGIWIPSST